ncbi:MAG: MATE family efflux transporter, partial [Candidatus Hydrogenedentes bacterium]|nr:MATE family efflux transporter [Candidatus Hydrogenedentota bacterium]
MQEQNLKELSTAPIRQLIGRYFWPAFIGIMAHSLYNIIDRIFIGHAVGAEALSGVAVVFPIMIIMAAFGMLIGVGASAQISLSLGRKDTENAQKILGNAVVLVFIISVVVTSIGFLIKTPMLRLFGANDTTLYYADSYLNYILWGVVVHQFGFSMNAIIRAEGNARIAMYSMLISAGLNIPLDALFILHWNMGVQGAAIATIISMSVLSVWVLLHFRSKRCVVALEKRYIRIEPKIVLAILSIGVSPFLMQLANSVVQGVFNLNLIKYGGDLAVGAMGIILTVTFIIITCIIALNMATQPIIGYNTGAGNYSRVKETLKYALITATLISTAAWIIIHTMPVLIVKAFITGNDEIVVLAVQGMHFFLLMLPV